MRSMADNNCRCIDGLADSQAHGELQATRREKWQFRLDIRVNATHPFDLEMGCIDGQQTDESELTAFTLKRPGGFGAYPTVIQQVTSTSADIDVHDPFAV